MRNILARARLPERSGCIAAEIVLCYLTHNNHTPYVTWQHNLPDGENDGFYWGHYFTDLHDANVDFIVRCQKSGAL